MTSKTCHVKTAKCRRHVLRDRLCALLGASGVLAGKLIMDAQMAGWPAMEYIIYTILGLGVFTVAGTGAILVISDYSEGVDVLKRPLANSSRMRYGRGYGQSAPFTASSSLSL